MIRRPPRSTLSSSSAASDVYKRQGDLQAIQQQSRKLVVDLVAEQRLHHLHQRHLDGVAVFQGRQLQVVVFALHDVFLHQQAPSQNGEVEITIVAAAQRR